MLKKGQLIFFDRNVTLCNPEEKFKIINVILKDEYCLFLSQAEYSIDNDNDIFWPAGIEFEHTGLGNIRVKYLPTVVVEVLYQNQVGKVFLKNSDEIKVFNGSNL
jgi:hypothetical protein